MINFYEVAALSTARGGKQGKGVEIWTTERGGPCGKALENVNNPFDRKIQIAQRIHLTAATIRFHRKSGYAVRLKK